MPASAPSGNALRTDSDDGSPTDALGCEWIVEAHGCDPGRLRDVRLLQDLFAQMRTDLRLTEVRPALWHTFPGPGGITGMSLLAESHLTCHTFPEHGAACFNLFCCRPRPEWDFVGRLGAALGATDVRVRRIDRRYVAEAMSGDGP